MKIFSAPSVNLTYYIVPSAAIFRVPYEYFGVLLATVNFISISIIDKITALSNLTPYFDPSNFAH